MSIYIARRRRKTSNALDTLVLSEQGNVSNERLKDSSLYTSDHGGQLTANFKSLVQRQQLTDDQVS